MADDNFSAYMAARRKAFGSPDDIGLAKFAAARPLTGGDLPSGPGMATNPSVPSQGNVEDILDRLAPKPAPKNTVGSAIARAIRGFAAGAANTPEQAGFESTAGGVVGGLKGIASGLEQDQARRDAANAPHQKVAEAILNKTAEQEAAQPFEIAKENRAAKERKEFKDYEVAKTEALMKKGSRVRAALNHVPGDVSDRLYDQAAANVQQLGMTPDSPGYNEMVQQEHSKAIADYLKSRQETPLTRPGAKKIKPVAANEFTDPVSSIGNKYGIPGGQ